MTQAEIDAQLLLPKEPSPPVPVEIAAAAVPDIAAEPVVPVDNAPVIAEGVFSETSTSDNSTRSPTVSTVLATAAAEKTRGKGKKKKAAVGFVAQVRKFNSLEVQIKTTATEKTAGRKSKKKTSSPAMTQGRTYAENDWVPPPPPAPFTAYQIPSFDARRIIYPGANYDPWWDMPQLIAQVCLSRKLWRSAMSEFHADKGCH